MIGTPFEYVQQYYQVPACIGRRVVAYGKPGVITDDFGHYIGITLDESTKRRPGRYHPVDGIEYGEMADRLPKQPRYTNWDRYNDEDWSCGFREFLGINRPHRERRKHEGQWQYRMYRSRSGYEGSRDRDVEGEWCSTAPLAKASYKAALNKREAT
ncbi:hypothetical protein [Pseudomonas monteilii]|uniref:Uncharacterized protein n=1 Tax=Pseudomonas monteilii TaxID=76759 RepID=A0A2N1IMA2_9PSED|nr:hypothetical protein [Pseudomonas monteilii]PKI19378.1 hypothetical protein CXB65_23095 [Pseudomonas monteilii]RPD91934.1 hypothetical protein EGN69_15870 [Pseudomonas monteilii]